MSEIKLDTEALERTFAGWRAVFRNPEVTAFHISRPEGQAITVLDLPPEGDPDFTASVTEEGVVIRRRDS